MGKTTVYLSWFLVLVILSASIYVMIPDKVKLVVENTNSKFYVWEDDSWVLSATEYVNLFDGTKKMRASSRDVVYDTAGDITTITRTSIWKDNITTIDVYKFDSTLDDVEQFPISHDVNCYNCVGKIMHFEYRDILYEGVTEVITSPFSFGHNMKLSWEDGAYYSKVFQQKVASDKIIVRYRPVVDVETFEIRVFDPPANESIDYTTGTPYVSNCGPNPSYPLSNLNDEDFTHGTDGSTYSNANGCTEGGYWGYTFANNWTITEVQIWYMHDGDVAAYSYNATISVNGTDVGEVHHDGGVGDYYNVSITPTVGDDVRLTFHDFSGSKNVFISEVVVLGYGTIPYADAEVNLILDGTAANRDYEYQTSVNISASADDPDGNICFHIGYPGYGFNYTCGLEGLTYFLYLGDPTIQAFADGDEDYDFTFPYYSWLNNSFETDVRYDIDSATVSLTGEQAPYVLTAFDDMTGVTETYDIPVNDSIILNLTVDADMTFLRATFKITSPDNFTNLSIDMFNDGVIDYNYTGTIDQYVSELVSFDVSLLNANISGTTTQTIPFNFSITGNTTDHGGNVTISSIAFVKVTQSYPSDIEIDIGSDGTSDAKYLGSLIGNTLYEDTNNNSVSSSAMICTTAACNYEMSFELNREQSYDTCYMYFLGVGTDSVFTEDFSDNNYMYSETLNVDNYFRQVQMNGVSGSYTNGEYVSKTVRELEDTKYYLTLSVSEQKDSGADIAYYISLDNGSNWYETIPNAPYFIEAGGKKPAYKFVMTSNAAKTAAAYVYGISLSDVGDYASDINLTVAGTQYDYTGTFNAAKGLYKANFGCADVNTYLESCTTLTCDVPVEINFTGPGGITASQFYFGGELDEAVLNIEVFEKHMENAKISTTLATADAATTLTGDDVYFYLSYPRYSVAKDLFINITGSYYR